MRPSPATGVRQNAILLTARASLVGGVEPTTVAAASSRFHPLSPFFITRDAAEPQRLW
jgi:hypothetical protein